VDNKVNGDNWWRVYEVVMILGLLRSLGQNMTPVSANMQPARLLYPQYNAREMKPRLL